MLHIPYIKGSKWTLSSQQINHIFNSVENNNIINIQSAKNIKMTLHISHIKVSA